MTFGFIYAAQGLIVYDVCFETKGGRETYVASLSVDPRVHFEAASADLALARLLAHLEFTARMAA